MNVSVDGKTHGEHSKYKGFEAFFQELERQNNLESIIRNKNMAPYVGLG